MFSNLAVASGGLLPGSPASSHPSTLAQFTQYLHSHPPGDPQGLVPPPTYRAPTRLHCPLPPPNRRLLEEQDCFYPPGHSSPFTRSLAHGWDFTNHNNSRSNNSRCSRHVPQSGAHVPCLIYLGEVRLPQLYGWGH